VVGSTIASFSSLFSSTSSAGEGVCAPARTAPAKPVKTTAKHVATRTKEFLALENIAIGSLSFFAGERISLPDFKEDNRRSQSAVARLIRQVELNRKFRAFVDTNPTHEPITSGLRVI
jgi:hypothetical protein